MISQVPDSKTPNAFGPCQTTIEFDGNFFCQLIGCRNSHPFCFEVRNGHPMAIITHYECLLTIFKANSATRGVGIVRILDQLDQSNFRFGHESQTEFLKKSALCLERYASLV